MQVSFLFGPTVGSHTSLQLYIVWQGAAPGNIKWDFTQEPTPVPDKKPENTWKRLVGGSNPYKGCDALATINP